MATASNIVQIQSDEHEELRRLTHMQRAMRRLKKDYLTLIALGVLLFLVVVAVTAPLTTRMMGIDAISENLQKTFATPDSANLLGTDDKGRDHLARLMYGGQVSLAIALTAACLSMSIGIFFGLITGYYGGVVDDILNWFVTTLESIPQLFLLLIVSAILSPSPLIFIGILGFLGWTGIMRLVRGETLSLREREYIVAAKAMGASNSRVMFQHIFPNLVSIVVITMTINIGGLILAESGLSFLGFGVQPPTPTWGNMLSESQAFFRKAPHLVVAPGLLISITVLCLYIIGDGLRDALDPTSRD
jgi:peptide/nickel transport system permease protein